MIEKYEKNKNKIFWVYKIKKEKSKTNDNQKKKN